MSIAASGRRPLRRRSSGRARPCARAACGILVAVLLLLLRVPSADAAGSVAAADARATFAEAFGRARLAVIATVEAAPPADAGYRLAVEATLKGERVSDLAFPADATSVTLVPGSRIVLLAMDPRSLDFRGTWTLAVAPDGTIDGDGLAGAPPTVDDLLRLWGAAAPAATLGIGPPGTPREAPGATTSDGGSTRPVAPAAVVAAAVLVAFIAGGIAVARRRRRAGA